MRKSGLGLAHYFCAFLGGNFKMEQKIDPTLQLKGRQANGQIRRTLYYFTACRCAL